MKKSANPSHLPSLLAISLFFAAVPLQANDWPQWRGPNRNGISQETGLLKQWPTNGPKLLWHHKDIGSGYSTPAVVGDRIYLLSNKGMNDEFVQALDVKDSKQIWSTTIGKVGPNAPKAPQYPGARSTPTMDGDWLFALGSDGDIAGFETKTGKLLWKKNLRTGFGGKPGTWAYSESVLVDGNTVVCTPGGSNATIVALNKKTGDVIWKCALPEDDEAAYASAIVVETGGVKQYVQLLQKGLVGVEAKTGKFLWRYTKSTSKYGANIPTPVEHNGFIYAASSGTGSGLVKLDVKDGAVSANEVYFSPKLPTAIGGSVKIGDHLYGTTSSAMMCVEFATGNVKWEERALGAASLLYADGRLYCHAENGDIALVEPTPDGYREKGRFTPPEQPKRANQMDKSWGYPVVANGRLYVREIGSLWCYDIKAGK